MALRANPRPRRLAGVNGRDGDAARVTADGITAGGGRAVAHPGSPSDQSTAESLVDRCIDEFGAVHILVNCAGIAEPPGSSILDISHAQFDELLESHLGTVFATCRAAAPKMVEQGAAASSTPARSHVSATTAAPGTRPARARSTAWRWRSPQN
jgi:NAD(P)-dependent dehydrogenase (short-subunit alcohol dehydrogenase family)